MGQNSSIEKQYDWEEIEPRKIKVPIVHHRVYKVTDLVPREQLYVKHWETHSGIILKKISDSELKNILPFIKITDGNGCYCDEGEPVTLDERLQQEWDEIEKEYKKQEEATMNALSYHTFIMDVQTASQLEMLISIDKEYKLRLDMWMNCVKDLLIDVIVNKKTNLLMTILQYKDERNGKISKFYYRFDGNRWQGEIDWYNHTPMHKLFEHYGMMTTNIPTYNTISLMRHLQTIYELLPDDNKLLFKCDCYMSAYLLQNPHLYLMCEEFFNNRQSELSPKHWSDRVESYELCQKIKPMPDCSEPLYHILFSSALIAGRFDDAISYVSKDSMNTLNYGICKYNQGYQQNNEYWFKQSPMYLFLNEEKHKMVRMDIIQKISSSIINPIDRLNFKYEVYGSIGLLFAHLLKPKDSMLMELEKISWM